MSGGRIAALVFAIILLVPGGCFIFFGVRNLHDDTAAVEAFDVGPTLLLTGLAILSVTGFLTWLAFRKRKQSQVPM
jgi:hypothetical protein